MIHKNLLRFFCLCITAAQLTSCATNYYVERKPASVEKEEKPLEVYVTNPDHYAFKILRDSHIYTLTDNPKAPNKLTLGSILDPDSYSGGCGLGAGFAALYAYYFQIFTLGLIPVGSDDNDYFLYNLESNGTTKPYKHEIKYSHSRSTWEILFIPFAYSEEEAKAKALSRSKKEICEDPTCGIIGLLATE